MKKSLIIIMLLTLIASFTLISGCSKEAETVEPAEEKMTYTMKFGHSMPTDTTRHRALEDFKAFVEEKSDGQLVIEIYPSGQLGKEAEMLEAMKLGSLEGYSGGVFDSITPKLNIYLTPFLFEDQDALMKFSQSDFAMSLHADAENMGIKLLAVGDAGSRNITNNIRPVQTPADLQGLKMRTPPVPAIIQSMEALGANPVSIPYVEVYMALKTGVADGQENPFNNIATMKFQEVQKYMTVVHYMFNPEPFCVQKAWYDALPADLQMIMQEGADLYTAKQNEYRSAASDADLQTIMDAGVEVYYPTPAERQMFIDATASVADFFIDEMEYFTREDLDKAFAIVSE